MPAEFDPGGLHGDEGDVGDDPDALGPDGVRRVALRQRAEIPEEHDRGQQQHAHGGEQAVADQRPAGELGVLGALVERGERLGAVLGRGVMVVTLLGDLAVRHQLLRPLDGREPDQEQRETEKATQRQVQGADAEDRRVARHGEVGDEEAEAAHRGQHQHAADLTLGAACGTLVDVGQPRFVVLQAGVGHGAAGLDVGARTVAAAPWPWSPDGTCSMSLTWRALLSMPARPRSRRATRSRRSSPTGPR